MATTTNMTDIKDNLDDLIINNLSRDDLNEVLAEESLLDNKEDIDNIVLLQTTQSVIDDIDLEGFILKHITNYKYEKGNLYLLYELEIREYILMPFK